MKKKNKVLAMADKQHDAEPRTLKDYVQPIVNDNYLGITHQPFNAYNFELNPALISMVQQAQSSGHKLNPVDRH